MNPIPLNGPEFTFFPPGLESGEAKYSALANQLSVVFWRVDANLPPIGVVVSRDVVGRLGIAGDTEAIVRRAIGQALRDKLFDTHPNEDAHLDADAPPWLGNLTRVADAL